jgi:hypothetical protein
MKIAALNAGDERGKPAAVNLSAAQQRNPEHCYRADDFFRY